MPLIIGGGYGLFLKQNAVLRPEIRTLFDPDAVPENRSTEDIDLFLRGDVVSNAEQMRVWCVIRWKSSGSNPFRARSFYSFEGLQLRRAKSKST